MTRRSDTIDATWFETLYRADGDPWGFASSPYERDKYRATLEALDRPRYGSALEIGCAIGVMTAQLAERCDTVLGLDGSATALAEAARRCSRHPHVVLHEGIVPDGFPAGRFDLVVASEVLYYLSEMDLRRTALACVDAQPDGGTMLLCHWLGDTDYPLTGTAAADGFVAVATARGYHHDLLHHEVYRLDRLTRR